MGHYTPTIEEGFYPIDAGWTEEQGGSILLLCVPELELLVQKKVARFDYAWLYDSTSNAYIFCFRLEGMEYAIIFQFKHAGKLLLEQMAYETFSIAITSSEFEAITEQTPYLFLSSIRLERQPIAGW